MEERTTATLEKIQEAARAEFLDKGFQGASLRQIVKNAGVTTGAFYGYFSSKEALFNALVEPHATALMGKFMEAQISFAELPEEQQLEHMGVESGTYPDWMGQHREPVKLLLTRAEGTSYERFVHNMVEVEVVLHHVLGRLLQMLGNAKQVLGIQKDIFSVGTALPALGAMKLEGLVRPDGYVVKVLRNVL